MEQNLTYDEYVERVEYHLFDSFGLEIPLRSSLRPSFEAGETIRETVERISKTARNYDGR